MRQKLNSRGNLRNFHFLEKGERKARKICFFPKRECNAFEADKIREKCNCACRRASVSEPHESISWQSRRIATRSRLRPDPLMSRLVTTLSTDDGRGEGEEKLSVSLIRGLGADGKVPKKQLSKHRSETQVNTKNLLKTSASCRQTSREKRENSSRVHFQAQTAPSREKVQ